MDSEGFDIFNNNFGKMSVFKHIINTFSEKDVWYDKKFGKDGLVIWILILFSKKYILLKRSFGKVIFKLP